MTHIHLIKDMNAQASITCSLLSVVYMRSWLNKTIYTVHSHTYISSEIRTVAYVFAINPLMHHEPT